MNKFTKRLAAAGLCLVLTAGALTGCSDKSGKAIATLDGVDTEYAIANIMLRCNQAQMYTNYSSYMGENMWETYGEDTKTGMMDNLKEMLILEKHMDEYGVTVTDEDKTAITAAATQFMSENEEKVLKSMGATQERVERVLTLYTIQAKMSNAMVADVDTNVTDEEAAQKTVKYVLFSTADTYDEAGNAIAMTDDEKANLQSQAEMVVEAMTTTADTDLETALVSVTDTQTVLTESYGAEDEDSVLEETVRAEADKLKDGETSSVIATDAGYYVVYMESTFDEEATATEKENIVAERQNEKFTEVYEEWEAAANFTEATDLLATMTFEDVYEMYVEETEAVAETAAE